jgi:hypothetical protein
MRNLPLKLKSFKHRTNIRVDASDAPREGCTTEACFYAVQGWRVKQRLTNSCRRRGVTEGIGIARSIGSRVLELQGHATCDERALGCRPSYGRPSQLFACARLKQVDWMT